MAEQVTGLIGQEEVQLLNAATEATLVRLLKVMEGKGGGAPGAAGATNKLATLGKESGKTTKEIDELGEAAKDSGMSLRGGFANVRGAAKGLVSEFILGGDRLSDYTAHITGLINQVPLIGPLLGGPVQFLISAIDKQVDTFRELQNTGVSLGGSLMDARLAATRTGMSMESYTGILVNNSAMLTRFGGTAGAGAKTFTNLMHQMQANREEFLLLGFTMQELGEGTANYMHQQAMLGRTELRSSKARALSVGNYIKESDKLARLTGKTREEAQQDMNAVSMDARVMGMLSVMEEGARNQITATLAFVKGKNKDLGDAMTELIATGGVAVSENAASYVLLNQGIADAAKAMSLGLPGAADQMLVEIEKARQNVLDMSEDELADLGRRVVLGDEIAKRQLELIQFGDGNVDALKIINEQIALQASQNALFLTFSADVQSIKNQMFKAFIESGVFTKVSTALTTFKTKIEKWIATGGFMTLFGTAMDSVTKHLDDLGIAMDNGTLWETIKTKVSEAFTGLGKILGDLMANVFVGLKNRIADSLFGKREMEGPDHDQTATGPRDGSGMFSNLIDGFKALTSGDITTGLGLLEDYIKPAGLILAGLLAFKVLASMFAVGTPASLGLIAIGAFLIGTGYGIKLAGQGIQLAGEGMQTVADAVKDISNLKDTANFADIAKTLGLLGPALISLTKAGVLDSIRGFFGLDSPFKILIDGINEFATIDPLAVTKLATLDTVGDSIALLAPAFERLNAKGSLLSSIKGWFGVDSPFEKLAKGINEFKSVDAVAIANIKASATSLDSLSGLSDKLDSGSLEKYAAGLERIAAALSKMNDELTADNSWLPFYKGETAASAVGGMGGGTGSGSMGTDGAATINTTMLEVRDAVRHQTAMNKVNTRDIVAANSNET